MRKLTTAPLAICAVAAFVSPAQSATWVWQADNHTQDLSCFTDGSTTFTLDYYRGTWLQDQYAAGTTTFQTTSGWDTDSEVGWGQAVSSDFGDALDLSKGITISARVKPINEHSQYSLCLHVNNASTKGLPQGSAHLYVGWAVPDWVRIYNKEGRMLRQTTQSVRQYLESEWFLWTLSAKRIGDTVAWDVWLNGEHQDADQAAPDGSLHTIVYAPAEEGLGTGGTKLMLGLRSPILYVHDTIFDYVAVTNDGVIPAWDGGEQCAKAAGPAEIPTDRSQGLLDSIFAAERNLRQGEYTSAKTGCDAASASIAAGNADLRAQEVLTVFRSRLAKAYIGEIAKLHQARQHQQALEICESALAQCGALPLRYKLELLTLKVVVLLGLERKSEAITEVRRLLPDVGDSEIRTSYRIWLGVQYYENEQFADAAPIFEPLLADETAPTDARAKSGFLLGMCRLKQHDEAAATAVMQLVVRQFPGNRWADMARQALSEAEALSD